MTENRAPSHFIYLILLALLWGTAYMFVKISLESVPPLTISAARTTIGAIILTLIALKMGIKLPRELSQWRDCAIIGVAGTVIPFFLLNWSIQYVHSSLAAICMSLLPLFTVVLAHYLTHDEKFKLNKLIGIFFGMIGVASLFYGTMTGVDSGPQVYLALIGLIATSFFYALSGVLIKRLKNKNPISMASAMLIVSSVMTIPLALIFDSPWTITPSLSSIYSILMLGAFSTAMATLLLFHLTHLAGATFVSYSTYLLPLVGISSGYIWLDEPLKITYILSVLFIFIGIFLAENGKIRTHIKNKI
ncbi:hypothetical protein MNBD_ALPHA01-65 [hydrothermal vent metagenome]|uniref:EamA domain-containing protein n=1 Tax=hydrothermal vent metagenome TaxID=652676 RepID=A0A3B0SH29_9ZZZZ